MFTVLMCRLLCLVDSVIVAFYFLIITYFNNDNIRKV